MPDWSRSIRLGGLRRFAVAITILNGFGHTVLGFEQSWAQPLVALAVAYALELFLEWIDAAASGRVPAYRGGGVRGLVDFLLSAHITALAVSMLLYANDRLLPIAFACAVAIGSKRVLRLRVGERSRHVLNPSNFGITVVLLLFPWVGIAPPYQFTEGVAGPADWILPAFVVVSGTFINMRFTGRLPLIAAWLIGFVTQALVRSFLFGSPLVPSLVPMTGLAFVLFTFYMATDPATTPSGRSGQVLFGACVAAAYGVLMSAHVVFGLFFSLTAVCGARAMGLYLAELVPRPRDEGARLGAAESRSAP